jgi:hypothetical protein
LQNPFCLQIWPWARNTKNNYCYSRQLRFFKTFLVSDSAIGVVKVNLFALTLLWLVLIKINTVSANFNNTGPYSRQLRFFKMFFGNDIVVQTVQTCNTGCGSHFENPTNFKILKEPLLVQKQALHQQKALDLSYLEPEGQGRGIIMRAWQCH